MTEGFLEKAGRNWETNEASQSVEIAQIKYDASNCMDVSVSWRISTRY